MKLNQPLFSVELDRLGGSLHVWAGPLGLHLFWPDVHKSRPDWCWRWNESPEH